MLSGDEYYSDEITSGNIYDNVPEDEDRENMIFDLEEYYSRYFLEALSWRELNKLWLDYFG